jgi:hypothetical protein
MRAGTEAAPARVVRVFSAARLHQAHLFANRRANRMKVLAHTAIRSLIPSAKLNGHAPHAYLSDSSRACPRIRPVASETCAASLAVNRSAPIDRRQDGITAPLRNRSDSNSRVTPRNWARLRRPPTRIKCHS